MPRRTGGAIHARLALTIAGGLLIAAILAGVAWERAKPPAAVSAPSGPAEGYFNDKVLVVSGWNAEEMRKVVSDFTRLYGDQLPPNFDFEIATSGDAQRVTFPHDMPPWMFLYLVNYTHYPKAPDLAGHEIHVAGITTLSPDFELPAQDLYGKRAVFYVPADDADYDNVYARVGAQAWKISFKGTHWEAADDPRWPAALDPYAGG